jgi:hypothetical protein
MPLSKRRRQLERALGDVEIPDPFDLAAFCTAIQRARRRPLVMHQLSTEQTSGFCGLFVELPQADHVFYPAGTSTLHQQHIVVHELAHLLSGHVGRPTAVLTDEILRELLPDLDPALVRIALGRSGYTDPQEREAEMLASLILKRVGHGTGDTESDPSSARIESIFG